MNSNKKNNSGIITLFILIGMSILSVGCKTMPQTKIEQTQAKSYSNLDDITDEVQNEINALDDIGKTIVIPPNAKFHLKNLVFTRNVNLQYSENSNLDIDSGTTKRSDERVLFMANANKNGLVNEYIISSPFHPSLILDLRKDIFGQDKRLGRNQQMNNPGRSSFIFRDEGLNQVVMQYKNFQSDSRFAGWNVSINRNIYVIKGVGQKSFGLNIMKGDVISNGKNAFGIVERIEEDEMDIFWTSGRFNIGDNLYVKGNKSKSKINKTKIKSENTNSIGLNRMTGYTSIGLPNGNAIHPLVVGGRIGIQPSRTAGQYLPETIREPAIVFSDSFEKETNKGYQITVDNYYGQYRAVLKDLKGLKTKAHLGSVGLHTAFDKKLLHSHSSFNVKSIHRKSKGKYIIEFINPFDSYDYQVGVSTSHPLDYVYVISKQKHQITVGVVKTGTDKFKEMEGIISVICTGGDR